jgi:hypothetical protein
MTKPPEKQLEKVPLRAFRSLEQIVDAIVDGHATEKHIPKFAALGVTKPQALKEHLMEILPSLQTECFSNWHHEPDSRADFFYHEPTNTCTVFPYKQEHEPTTYRPPNGRAKFDHKYTKAILCAEETGLMLPPPGIYRGINSLHPDLRIKEVIFLHHTFKK